MSAFWAGAGAATIGAIAVSIVTYLLDARSRRLRSLRTVRAEIRANLLWMKMESTIATSELPSTTPVFIPISRRMKDAVSPDQAYWREETSRHVEIFYGGLDLLNESKHRHDAEVKMKQSDIALGDPPRDPRVTRATILLARDESIVFGEAALTHLDAEIEAVKSWAVDS